MVRLIGLHRDGGAFPLPCRPCSWAGVRVLPQWPYGDVIGQSGTKKKARGAPPPLQEKRSRQGDITYLIKDILELVLGQRRAFNVFHCTQLPCHLLPILFTHRLHTLLRQLLLYARIIAKIGLRTNDQAWHPRAMVMHFWEPLFADVFERSRGSNREADKEDIGLRIRQGAQAIIVFLSSSIEQAEGVGLIADPGEFGLVHAFEHG